MVDSMKYHLPILKSQKYLILHEQRSKRNPESMRAAMAQAIMCQTKFILAEGLWLCRCHQLNSQIGQLKKSSCQCKRAQPNVTYTRAGSQHIKPHTHTHKRARSGQFQRIVSPHTSNKFIVWHFPPQCQKIYLIKSHDCQPNECFFLVLVRAHTNAISVNCNGGWNNNGKKYEKRSQWKTIHNRMKRRKKNHQHWANEHRAVVLVYF